jgi:excisionase family DNA binding protein
VDGAAALRIPAGRRWLEIDAVARVLGVSPSTVRRLIREGALPCFRFRRRALRIAAADLVRFVNAARLR